MSRIRKLVAVRAALFAALLLSACAALVRIDVTGEWTGIYVWTTGPQAGTGIETPISLSLVHEGKDVTGTVTLMGPGSQPFDLTIVDGRAEGRSIGIHATGTLDLGTTLLEVTILLDGDFDEANMSGTGSQSFGVDSYQFTWEMVRLSGPPPT
jgi:hypothetical protein